MSEAGSVLLVDDDPHVLHALEVTFRALGFDCRACANGEEALSAAAQAKPGLALVDLAMPGMNGIELLRSLKEKDPLLPVVIMTAFGDLDSAVRAVHEGAYDYLTKPLDLQRLRILAKRALEVRALSLAVERDRQRPGGVRPRIIGRHPAMVEVFKAIGAASRPGNRSTVLILGETGTGKELVARSIHEAGDSRMEPFVVVSCAGVPETLVESELFGHERGAFTGAVERRIGKVEAAGEGTVFLDEVGDLPPGIQQKFLRLLESGEYERVGSNETRTLRARFIAATHRDLLAARQAGQFREDLYYRLGVVMVKVPALRERREDVALLVDHFLDRHSKPPPAQAMAVSPRAMSALLAYDYPGNVRELEHLIEQAVARAQGNIVLPEHLPALSASPARPAAIPILSPLLEEARRLVMEEFERQFVVEALRATSGNVTEAAERSGIQRQSFQRLMQRHGVVSEAYRS
ncbi:MAG: sigma-54-dependent Fis family transcriptional regulator [Myxococcales bacterium]|nr:sigma-54-dependent Fis family transcriptional regulator [Myxococcales bacterium]